MIANQRAKGDDEMNIQLKNWHCPNHIGNNRWEVVDGTNHVFLTDVSYKEAEAESVRLNREAGWTVNDFNEEE